MDYSRLRDLSSLCKVCILMNVINEINKSRIQVYYNLNELIPITGLKARALKYRMLDVKQRYAETPHLLNKEGRSWKIHYTLIIEFMPKYSPNTQCTLPDERHNGCDGKRLPFSQRKCGFITRRISKTLQQQRVFEM